MTGIFERNVCARLGKYSAKRPVSGLQIHFNFWSFRFALCTTRPGLFNMNLCFWGAGEEIRFQVLCSLGWLTSNKLFFITGHTER